MTPLDAALRRLASRSPATETPVVPPDRLRALLYGLAIGDALGNTTESMRPRDRYRRYGEIAGYLPNRHAGGRPVGVPSDDTQMGFWLLEHLLEHRDLYPDLLARTFLEREIYGMGRSVRAFRSNLAAGVPWERTGSRSAGNGAIMRIAPILALQRITGRLEVSRDAAVCAGITHNQEGAIASAVAWVHLLAELATRPLTPDAGLETFLDVLSPLEDEAVYRPRGGELMGAFEGPLSALLRKTVPDGLSRDLSVLRFGDLTYSGAYLLETLPVTLFILMRYLDDPDRAIREAVNHTRDNDTIASLVATAMGARHGMGAFREDWVAGLLGRTGAADDGRVQGLIEGACGI